MTDREIARQCASFARGTSKGLSEREKHEVAADYIEDALTEARAEEKDNG